MQHDPQVLEGEDELPRQPAPPLDPFTPEPGPGPGERRAFRAMRDLHTGITYINAGTTGAEVHLPFGGTKDTGNGHREAGQAALDVFTEWKAIYVDYSGKLQRAQIDNAP